MEEDVLLRYCVGLDAGDFDKVSKVLEQADTNESLLFAIQGLHKRFDSNESYTQQLQRVRGQLQKES